MGRKRRDHRRLYQERTGDKLNYVAQARELTELRADFDIIRAVHVTPLQCMLKSYVDAPFGADRKLDDVCHAVKVLSYVRPLKCSIHALRAHVVYADRIQIVETGSKPCDLNRCFRRRPSDLYPPCCLSP